MCSICNLLNFVNPWANRVVTACQIYPTEIQLQLSVKNNRVAWLLSFDFTKSWYIYVMDLLASLHVELKLTSYQLQCVVVRQPKTVSQ